MAWQDTLVPMVRALIGDDTDTPRYSNSRIELAIVTSGLIVAQEYPFTVAYTFDLTTPDINPDPTVDPIDPEAMALFTLKAACMLTLNNYQTAVGTGIRVRDGDSEVDTTGALRGYSDIIKLGPCASYTKLLQSLSMKRGMSQGGAVLSPHSFGTEPWGLRGYVGRWHIRSFFDYMLR